MFKVTAAAVVLHASSASGSAITFLFKVGISGNAATFLTNSSSGAVFQVAGAQLCILLKRYLIA